MKPSLLLLIPAIVVSTHTVAIGAAKQTPAQAQAQVPAVPASAAAAVEKPAAESDALTMKLTPSVAFAPAEVQVRIRVEPDARSRALSIEWWTADGVGGSHEVSLDGDRTALSQNYSIKQMEPGEYMVTAAVMRNDGTQVSRKGRVMVVDKGEVADQTGFGNGDPAANGPRTRGR